MSAHRSDVMTQSLVLSIDVCRGLGISPLRIKHLAEFFQADLGPRSAQEYFFFGLFGKFGTFVLQVCAHRKRYRILWQVSLTNFFLAKSRFHCHRSKGLG